MCVCRSRCEAHCIVLLVCEVSTFLPPCQSVTPTSPKHNTSSTRPSLLTGRAHSGNRRSPNPLVTPNPLAQGFPLSVDAERPCSAAFHFVVLPDNLYCLLVHFGLILATSPSQEADSDQHPACYLLACCGVVKRVSRLPPGRLALPSSFAESHLKLSVLAHLNQYWFLRCICKTLETLSTFRVCLTRPFSPSFPPLVSESGWTKGVRGESRSGNLLCLLATPDESLRAIVKQM